MSVSAEPIRTAIPQRYTLHPKCRVRKESFGLLFYDSRGPKLLFAESGNLVEPEWLRRGCSPTEGRDGWSENAERRVRRLLSTLVEKGFLLEQPLC